MSRTFQVTQNFENLTVEESVKVGAYNRHSDKEVDGKVAESPTPISALTCRSQAA